MTRSPPDRPRSPHKVSLDRKQRIAIVAAPAVLAVMYPTFWLTGYLFGERVDGYLGWAVGLAAYWLLWGPCSRCGCWAGEPYGNWSGPAVRTA